MKIEIKNKDNLTLRGEYLNKGNKSLFVMLHGFTGHYHGTGEGLFDHISSSLNNKYDQLRFSYSGNEPSDGEFEKQTMTDFIGDALFMIKKYAKDYERIIILGFSMGSLILSHITYMIEKEILKKIKKIFLLSPITEMTSLSYSYFENKNIGTGKNLVAKLWGDLRLSEDFVLDSLKYFASEKIREFSREVIIIQPEEDTTVIGRSPQFYLNNFRKSKYHLVKKADHSFSSKNYMDQVIEIINSEI